MSINTDDILIKIFHLSSIYKTLCYLLPILFLEWISCKWHQYRVKNIILLLLMNFLDPAMMQGSHTWSSLLHC